MAIGAPGPAFQISAGAPAHDISGLNAAEIKPGLRTRAFMLERTSIRVSNLGDVAFELVSARVSILVMIQCPLEIEHC